MSDQYYVLAEETSHDFGEPITMTVARTPDGAYIGNKDWAEKLCDKWGIKPELRSPELSVCSIGFNEKEEKWYGWSHRAIYGFGVGSKVKKGDCAFTADNPEEMIDDWVNFFCDFIKDDERRAQRMTECREQCWVAKDRSGIYINHASWVDQFGNIPMVKPQDLEDVLTGKVDVSEVAENLPEDWGSGISFRPIGRGEWTAETLEDAKQMASDFAEGVA